MISLQTALRPVALFLALTAAYSQKPARKQVDPKVLYEHQTRGYTDTPMIPGQKWRVHDASRPNPPEVTPGSESSPERPGRAPSDAIVLFDGKDFSKWGTPAGGQLQEPKWKLENGYTEVVPKSGGIVTREKFGDCQIHLEWASPAEVQNAGQLRGNSGVLLMNRYEIQVLDSSGNKTYADGQAGAIYGQHPPMVNAARKPGEWQTYDIFFEAPKFEGEKLVKPAYVTVVHNGVLVQHHQEITGRTPHARVGTYEAHAPEEPLGLQNHGTPVHYRNIWIRRLGQLP